MKVLFKIKNKINIYIYYQYDAISLYKYIYTTYSKYYLKNWLNSMNFCVP